MDPDQDRPPRVPQPRVGGGEPGEWCPVVPAPRVAPALETLPGRVATLADRPTPPAALLPVPRRAAAVAVPDPGLSGVLRTWGRAVVHAVQAAVDGVRSLLAALAPAPAPR